MTESPKEKQQNKMSTRAALLISTEIVRGADRVVMGTLEEEVTLRDFPLYFYFSKEEESRESVEQYAEEWLTIIKEYQDKMYRLSERVIRDHFDMIQE